MSAFHLKGGWRACLARSVFRQVVTTYHLHKQGEPPFGVFPLDHQTGWVR